MSKNETTGAIIQARMNSTRLPGKVLKDLDGKPVLKRVIDRAAHIGPLDRLIVATTQKTEDNRIVDYCDDLPDVHTFRGDEQDVLDRFYRASNHFDLDTIARITSDNPLLDPDVVEKAMRILHKNSCQYVSNRRNHRHPVGIYGEVMTYDALETAWQEADTDLEREHVTLYIRNNRDQFETASFQCEDDFSHHRWTLDEPDDLEFLRRVYKLLDDECAGYRDVAMVIEEHPELLEVNRTVEQKEQLSKLKDKE